MAAAPNAAAAALTRPQIRAKRQALTDFSYQCSGIQHQASRYINELEVALNVLGTDFKRQPVPATNMLLLAAQLPYIVTMLQDIKKSVDKTMNRHVQDDFIQLAQDLLIDPDDRDEEGKCWKDHLMGIPKALDNLKSYCFSNFHCITYSMESVNAMMESPPIDIKPFLVANLRLIQDWIEAKIEEATDSIKKIMEQ